MHLKSEEVNVAYKLEKHLEDICTQYKEYETLLAVWKINKKAFRDVLSNISQNFPHYTDHSYLHSEKIITNIEMLLGKENILSLSPTDTWMLLHVAYLHDFGMVLSECNIENMWGTQEFNDYCYQMMEASDESIKESIIYIRSLKEKLTENEAEKEWPLKIRKYVTRLIADYYRKIHAKNSRQYIDKMAREWGLDLGYNGLIPKRLIILLGEISYSHNEKPEQILELDYMSNGLNSDYIHPRFVAEMLRMGDLLDVDNNRVNPYIEKVIGGFPSTSKTHVEKHLSTRHILITPKQVEFSADCADNSTYRETRNFLTWLEEEIKFWTFNWSDIMPESIKGNAPKLKKRELLLKGIPDLEGVSDLHFEISQKRAFEVIEGSNLYEDKFVFIREIIQNAIDASKLQLWRDIAAGKYDAWINSADIHNLQPYDIPEEVYENYTLQVKMKEIDDNFIEVVVSDKGIGMNIATVKNLCNVGNSYFSDLKRLQEINQMPKWLKPTAGFGLGLQSIFLITDRFEINTMTERDGCIHVGFECKRDGGNVQITASQKRHIPGTDICLRLPKDMKFSFSVTGVTKDYISDEYDPFSKSNLMVAYKVVETILNNCDRSFFKINTYVEDRLVCEIPRLNIKLCDNENVNEDNQYRCYWDEEKCEIVMWDKRNYVFFRMRVNGSILEKSAFITLVKGMRISKGIYKAGLYGIQVIVDFYGEDTKETLTLNRAEIREQKLEHLYKIFDEALNYFIEKYKEIFIQNGKEVVAFHYIGSEEKERYAEKLSSIKVKCIKVIDDDVVEKDISLSEIINRQVKDNVWDIKNYDNYRMYDAYAQKHKHIDKIKEIIEKQKSEFEGGYIVIDSLYSRLMEKCSKSKIKIRSSSDEKDFYIFQQYSFEKKICVMADDESRKLLYLAISGNDTYEKLLDTNLGGNRAYIPAIDKFSKVAISKIPAGLKGIQVMGNLLLIFPIDQINMKEYEKFEKQRYIEYVTKQSYFKNLVDYTVEKNERQREEVEKEYISIIEDFYILMKKSSEENCDL